MSGTLPFYSFIYGEGEQILSNKSEACKGGCGKFLGNYFEFKWKQSSNDTLLDSRVCEPSDLPNMKVTGVYYLCPPKTGLHTNIHS